MNKIKHFLLIPLLLLMSGCFVNKIDIQKGDYSTYLRLTPELLQEKMAAKEDFIAVKGLSSCSHCQNFKVVLNEFLLKNSIPIYYYQIEAYDNLELGVTATSAEEMELMGVLLPSTYVPSLFFFDDGTYSHSHVVGGYSVEKLSELIQQYSNIY